MRTEAGLTLRHSDSLRLLIRGHLLRYYDLLLPLIGAARFDFHAHILTDGPRLLASSAVAPLAVTCVLGAALSWFSLQCRLALSPTSFAVVGVLCKVATVVTRSAFSHRVHLPLSATSVATGGHR